MDGVEQRRGIRSFLLGGLVGASAALAAARRRHPARPEGRRPGGLAAFEDAPCYRETIEREAEAARSRPRS